jgi:hypothetical protein
MLKRLMWIDKKFYLHARETFTGKGKATKGNTRRGI